MGDATVSGDTDANKKATVTRGRVLMAQTERAAGAILPLLGARSAPSPLATKPAMVSFPFFSINEPMAACSLPCQNPPIAADQVTRGRRGQRTLRRRIPALTARIVTCTPPIA